MNRVSFANNINFNVPIHQIIMDYFDELMTLYDLVCGYTNFKIEGNVGETSAISFNMIFDTRGVAESVSNMINNRIIYKYNRNFTCNTQHDINDNVLNVRLVS